jgi:hypothetical protein
LIEHSDLSRGGLGQTEEHFHGRGLARPVRAEKAVHLVSRHEEIEGVDGCVTTEPFRETVCANSEMGHAFTISKIVRVHIMPEKYLEVIPQN